MKCGISTSYSAVSQSHEAIEGGRLSGTARRADLLGHRLPPVAHVDDGAVGEAGPVHRIDRMQREHLGHVDPGGGERLLEQRRHRQDGRPGVEPVPVALETAGAATGHRLPLDHDHVVSPPGEVAGGAEPAQAGADDHDVHHASRHAARAASERSRAPIASGTGAPSSAARAWAWRSAINCSTASRAPQSTSRRAEPGDVALVEIRRADGGEQTCVLRSDELPRQSQQHRRLALAQVLADRLAGRGLVAEDAEQVVTQLEGLAERPAEGAEGLDEVGVGAGEDRAEVQGALDGVRARLVPGDEEGAFDGQGAPARAHDVEVLAHHQLRAQLVPDRPDGGAGGADEPIGAGEGQVADEDADALAEPSSLPPPPGPAMGLVEMAMQRRLAPTSGRAVHDVVVEEGEAVQQLDAGGDVQPASGRADRRQRPGSRSGRRAGGAACRRPASTASARSTGSANQGSMAAQRSRSRRRTARRWSSTSAATISSVGASSDGQRRLASAII